MLTVAIAEPQADADDLPATNADSDFDAHASSDPDSDADFDTNSDADADPDPDPDSAAYRRSGTGIAARGWRDGRKRGGRIRSAEHRRRRIRIRAKRQLPGGSESLGQS